MIEILDTISIQCTAHALAKVFKVIYIKLWIHNLTKGSSPFCDYNAGGPAFQNPGRILKSWQTRILESWNPEFSATRILTHFVRILGSRILFLRNCQDSRIPESRILHVQHSQNPGFYMYNNSRIQDPIVFQSDAKNEYDNY